MTELYFCLDCAALRSITIHGRCETCNSTAVVSQHLPTIQPALTGIERNERENHGC